MDEKYPLPSNILFEGLVPSFSQSLISERNRVPNFSPIMRTAQIDRAMTGSTALRQAEALKKIETRKRIQLKNVLLNQSDIRQKVQKSIKDYNDNRFVDSTSSKLKLSGDRSELIPASEKNNYFASKSFRDIKNENVTVGDQTTTLGDLLTQSSASSYQIRGLGDSSPRPLAYSFPFGEVPNFSAMLIERMQQNKAMRGATDLRHVEALKPLQTSRRQQISLALKDVETRKTIKNSFKDYSDNYALQDSKLKIKSDGTIGPSTDFNDYLQTEAFNKIKNQNVKIGNESISIEKLFKESQASTYVPRGKGDETINQLAYIQADGFVPNFASGYNTERGAIKDAISRESAALKARGVSNPKAKIKVSQSPRLKNPKNPQGYGVINTIDEPRGINQGIDRAISMGISPQTHGTIYEGTVPNFRLGGITKQLGKSLGGLTSAIKKTTGSIAGFALPAGLMSLGGGAKDRAGKMLQSKIGTNMQMGLMMSPMFTGGIEDGAAGTMGGMVTGGVKDAAMASSFMAMISDRKAYLATTAAIGALYGVLKNLEGTSLEVVKSIQNQIGENKRLIEGSDALIQSQERLNAAIASGDTDRVTKSIQQFQDVLYSFPTDLQGGQSLRDSLLAADGDILKMTEALSVFQKEAKQFAEISQIKMSNLEANEGEGREGLVFGMGPSKFAGYEGKLTEEGQKAFEDSGKSLVKTLKFTSKEVDQMSIALNAAAGDTDKTRENLKQFANSLDQDLGRQFAEVLETVPDDALASFVNGLSEMGKSVKTSEEVVNAFAGVNESLSNLSSKIKELGYAVGSSLQQLNEGIKHAFDIAESQLNAELSIMEGLNLITGEQSRNTQAEFETQRINTNAAVQTEGLTQAFVQKVIGGLKPSEFTEGGSAFEGPLGNLLRKMSERGIDPTEDIRFNAKDVISEIMVTPESDRTDDEKRLIEEVRKVNDSSKRQIDLLKKQNEITSRQEAVSKRMQLSNTQLDFGQIAPQLFTFGKTTQDKSNTVLGIDSQARATQDVVNLVKEMFGETTQLNQLEQKTGEDVAIGNALRVIEGFRGTGLTFDLPKITEERPEGFNISSVISAIEKGVIDNQDVASKEQLTVLTSIADSLRNQERAISETPVDSKSVEAEVVRKTAESLGIDLSDLGFSDAMIGSLDFEALNKIGDELSEQGTQIKLLQGIEAAVETLPADFDKSIQSLRDAISNIKFEDDQNVEKYKDAKDRQEESRSAVQDVAIGGVDVTASSMPVTANNVTIAGTPMPSSTNASFLPNFAPDPLMREEFDRRSARQKAISAEKKAGASPVIDRHPMFKDLNPAGEFVRDRKTQKNFLDVIKTHPEGMNKAVQGSLVAQKSMENSVIPNFAIAGDEPQNIEEIKAQINAVDAEVKNASIPKSDADASTQKRIKNIKTSSKGIKSESKVGAGSRETSAERQGAALRDADAEKLSADQRIEKNQKKLDESKKAKFSSSAKSAQDALMDVPPPGEDVDLSKNIKSQTEFNEKVKASASRAKESFTEEKVNVKATDRTDTKKYSDSSQNQKVKSVQKAQKAIEEQKTVARATVESVDERMSKFQSKLDADEKLSKAVKNVTSTDAKYRKLLGIDSERAAFLSDGTSKGGDSAADYKKRFRNLSRMLHPDAKNFDGASGKAGIADSFPEFENLRGDDDAIKEFKFRKMQELTAAKADWDKMIKGDAETVATQKALSPEEKSSLMKQRQEALIDRMKVVQQNPDAKFKQAIPDWMDDWMRTNPDAFEEIVEQETIKGKTYENWNEAEIKQWEAESGEKIQKRAEARQSRAAARQQTKADQQVKTSQQDPDVMDRSADIDDPEKKARIKRMSEALDQAEADLKNKRIRVFERIKSSRVNKIFSKLSPENISKVIRGSVTKSREKINSGIKSTQEKINLGTVSEEDSLTEEVKTKSIDSTKRGIDFGNVNEILKEENLLSEESQAKYKQFLDEEFGLSKDKKIEERSGIGRSVKGETNRNLGVTPEEIKIKNVKQKGLLQGIKEDILDKPAPDGSKPSKLRQAGRFAKEIYEPSEGVSDIVDKRLSKDFKITGVEEALRRRGFTSEEIKAGNLIDKTTQVVRDSELRSRAIQQKAQGGITRGIGVEVGVRMLAETDIAQSAINKIGASVGLGGDPVVFEDPYSQRRLVFENDKKLNNYLESYGYKISEEKRKKLVEEKAAQESIIKSSKASDVEKATAKEEIKKIEQSLAIASLPLANYVRKGDSLSEEDKIALNAARKDFAQKDLGESIFGEGYRADVTATDLFAGTGVALTTGVLDAGSAFLRGAKVDPSKAKIAKGAKDASKLKRGLSLGKSLKLGGKSAAFALAGEGIYEGSNLLEEKIAGTTGEVIGAGGRVLGGAVVGFGYGGVKGAIAGGVISGFMEIADLAYKGGVFEDSLGRPLTKNELLEKKKATIERAKESIEKMRVVMAAMDSAAMIAEGNARTKGTIPSSLPSIVQGERQKFPVGANGLPADQKYIAAKEAYATQHQAFKMNIGQILAEARKLDEEMFDNRDVRQKGQENWLENDPGIKYLYNTEDTVSGMLTDLYRLYDPDIVIDSRRTREIAMNQDLDIANPDDFKTMQTILRSEAYEKIDEKGNKVKVDWSKEDPTEIKEKSAAYHKGLRRIAQMKLLKGEQGMFDTFGFGEPLGLDEVVSIGRDENFSLQKAVMGETQKIKNEQAKAKLKGADDFQWFSRDSLNLSEDEKGIANRLNENFDKIGEKGRLAFLSETEKAVLKKMNLNPNDFLEAQGSGTRAGMMLSDGEKVKDPEQWLLNLQNGRTDFGNIPNYPYGAAREMGIPTEHPDGTKLKTKELEEQLKQEYQYFNKTGSFRRQKKTAIEEITDFAGSDLMNNFSEVLESDSLKSRTSVLDDSITEMQLKAGKDGWSFSKLPGDPPKFIARNQGLDAVVPLGDLSDP